MNTYLPSRHCETLQIPPMPASQAPAVIGEEFGSAIFGGGLEMDQSGQLDDASVSQIL